MRPPGTPPDCTGCWSKTAGRGRREQLKIKPKDRKSLSIFFIPPQRAENRACHYMLTLTINARKG